MELYHQKPPRPLWVDVLGAIAFIIFSIALYVSSTNYYQAVEKNARMERFIELEQKGQKSP